FWISPLCTRSAIPRHGPPNAIAKNEADDHADQKSIFILCAQKKGPGGCSLKTNLALTTTLLSAMPSAVLKPTFAEFLRSYSRNRAGIPLYRPHVLACA